MSGTLEPTEEPNLSLVAVGGAWIVVLGLFTPVVAAIAIARRGWPLEGWTVSYLDVLLGWSLITLPYVVFVGMPVVLGSLATTRLLHLSGLGATLLAAPLSFGLFVALLVIASPH